MPQYRLIVTMFIDKSVSKMAERDNLHFLHKNGMQCPS